MTDLDPVDRRPQKQTARAAPKHAKTPLGAPFEVAVHKQSNKMRVGDLPSLAGVEFRISQTLTPVEFSIKVRDEISARFLLSPAARKLLEVLQPQAEAGEQLARLDLAECQRRLGERAPSKSTFHRGISELLAKKIVAKSEIDSCFHFAPIFGSHDANGRSTFSVADVIEVFPKATVFAKVSRSGPRVG